MEDIRVVIPILVIDELDDAKSDKIRGRARQTLKLLYGYFGQAGVESRVLRKRSTNSGQTSVELMLDVAGHQRLSRADDELIDRAGTLQGFIGRPVDFISFDTGAVLRAGAAGLRARRLEHAS
jgi:predicted ribonuclease YlaK